jgi:hypothetical protein
MEEIGLEWSWLADLTAYKLENKQLLSKLDLPGGDARLLFSGTNTFDRLCFHFSGDYCQRK